MATYGGLGTQLQIAHPTTAFAIVSQVVEINGPESEMGEREITHLGSTGAREFAPTICDNGEISGSLWFDPAQASHVSFQQMVQKATTVAGSSDGSVPMKIVLPTTTKTFTFNGFVKRFAITGLAIDGTVGADWSVRISGSVTYPTT